MSNTIFDEIAKGDWQDILSSLKQEAHAAVTSDDAMLQKWGRSIGSLAHIVEQSVINKVENIEVPEVPVDQGINTEHQNDA